jgi:hypothetical protein
MNRTHHAGVEGTHDVLDRYRIRIVGTHLGPEQCLLEGRLQGPLAE